MPVKFNIVEGEYDLITDYPINDITYDYLCSNLTIPEIREKYNISQTSWDNVILRYFRENGVCLRNQRRQYFKDLPLEDIIKDYTGTILTVEEIMVKYGLSHSLYRSLLVYLREHNIPLRGKSNCNHGPRYYYRTKSKSNPFTVMRSFGGRVVSFGCYKTEVDAEARVAELESNGWEGYL